MFNALSHVQGLVISTAHASTAEEFATWTVAQFTNQFWTPFGALVTLGLTIALAGMIYRRIRGTARRPH